MQYLPIEDRETLTVQRAPERENWTSSIDQGNTAVARSLTLEAITEFDPRHCNYRDGHWVE